MRPLPAVISLVTAVALAPAPATAGPLSPIENWTIDYGTTQCTAAASYGAPASPVVLGIVPSLDETSYQLLVSVPRAGPAFAQDTRATVDFGRGPMVIPALYYGRAGVPMSVYRYQLTAAQMTAARGSTGIALNTPLGGEYTFALANMAALMDGLDNCSRDLRQYWNVGAGVAQPAKSAAADVRDLFGSQDYPMAVLGGFNRAHTFLAPAAYQLMVDESGLVAGCDVRTSSGAPVLDTSFCDVMKARARFAPARDSRGQAIRSVVGVNMGSWADQNTLNSGCIWQTGVQGSVVSTCRRQDADRVPPYAFLARVPPQPTK